MYGLYLLQLNHIWNYMSTNLLPPEQFWEYAIAFEQYHSLFYKFWSLGKPYFTTDIPTAAIRYDSRSEQITFLFNPNFWNESSKELRLFAIAHECLHVLLNHPNRGISATNKKLANKAADLVVNQELVNSYGFDRTEIDPTLKFCWVDTIIPNRKLPTNKSYEHYYKLLSDISDSDSECDGGILVDDHATWEDVEKFLEYLAKNFNDYEHEAVAKLLGKHCPAGKHGVNQAHIFNGRISRKKKWETVIQTWTKTNKPKYVEKDVDQWVHKDRRHTMLSNDMFLPSTRTVDVKDRHDKKVHVAFFLDTSGSCWNLKDRFFAAATSLSPEIFDVDLYCFDTEVYETTLASKAMYGGGGTRFDIIETKLQELCKAGKPYPTAVFLISDGYGNEVIPQYPEKWFWFLDGYSPNTTYIDTKSKIYELRNFE